LQFLTIASLLIDYATGERFSSGVELQWPEDDVTPGTRELRGVPLADELCERLFENWCEKRCVIALTYLLYGWPMSAPCGEGLIRLLESMKHLRILHNELLSDEEVSIIAELVKVIDHELFVSSLSAILPSGG
jgi:hypothetical protein